jgi:hypothetical protein
VQEKGGNKESTAGYAQEPQASHPGCLPCLWHQSIQDREKVDL